MKIGIILFSSTGHTRQAAGQLENSLSHKGHQVTFLPLDLVGELSNAVEQTKPKSIHDVSKFDVLVLASPVHGGRLNAPMASFLEASPPLKGKQIILMATHFFPYTWGCRQMFHSMRSHRAISGSDIIGEGEVMWLGFNRGRRIDAMVEHLNSLL